MSERRLVRSLQRLSHALAKLERQTAAQHDISASQLRILLALGAASATAVVESAGEPSRVSELARTQGLAVSTMTRNLDVLERKGFILRRTGQSDRRTVTVCLTDDGAGAALRLRDATTAQYHQAFRRFHPSDRVERAVALDRVAEALEGVAAP